MTARTLEVADHAKLPAAPVVSVLMVAYNHAGYLAEAVEGVLAQRCDFPFELLIGEDCSSDRTLEIALDYQSRHPGVIRVVHAEANVGGDNNLARIRERARGRWIAYCDGDDYWCDPAKLARQVGIGESDPSIAAVHADWVRARRVDGRWVPERRSAHAGFPRSLLQGDLFGHFYFPRILRSCTLMYRRDAVEAFFASEFGARRYRFGDTVTAAYVTSRWKVGYVDAVTSVYRESPNSALRSGAVSKLRFLQSALEFDTDARRYFAARPDYPTAYRWEIGIGLFARACRLREWGVARAALADLRAHYTAIGFLRAGWRAASLRAHALFPASGPR